MNNTWCLIFIGLVMHISKSNASSDSADEELLERLLQMVMDLNTEVQTLKRNLTILTEQLPSTSILPPFRGVTYAVCAGRLSGLSGDNTIPSGTYNEDLRCPPGSMEVEGPQGQRDISGQGIDPGPFFMADFGIDGCEERCIETETCVAFNWLIANNRYTCELFATAEPDSPYQPDPGAIITCALRTDDDQVCEIGEIITWSGFIEDLPEGYLLADGSEVDDTDYGELCDFITGVCGGLGCTLPDLEGRFPVGAGNFDDPDGVETSECSGGGNVNLPFPPQKQ